MAQFADIILAEQSEALDRTFQYRIPPELQGVVRQGSCVDVPFGRGNSRKQGYVIGLTDTPSFEVSKIKEIAGLTEGAVRVNGELIGLAAWMRQQYGSTMSQALKMVLPVRTKVRPVIRRQIDLKADADTARAALEQCRSKHQKAKVRLLEALLADGTLPATLAAQKLNIGSQTLKALERDGLIEIREETVQRNPLSELKQSDSRIQLTPAQQAVRDGVLSGYEAGDRRPCLIHGITGSGKTEVYMEIMESFLRRGKQVILLIPEISLTYQTVMRFYRRYGDRVSIVNSRLSEGERYEQFQRAKRGELDIMIGPRSALFTPFPNLGLIVIDEEHDTAYKSEQAPRYHAREVAIQRMKERDGLVLLGSATPSVDSYYAAEQGAYRLFTLKERAVHGSILPKVWVEDLREELKTGNKSIFSRRLQAQMEQCLQRGEQMMLFLNRRGYAGFVSCRSCGEAFMCPHCDISLTSHRSGELVCHYCGYRIPIPRVCPSCGSPYIAGFGLGTQKVEALTAQAFPGIRTLRMDYDTTSGKGGHQAILEAFAAGEADVLIGTQMIVKGHDFPNVTLVGILAADLSLNGSDFRASERTFQLLTQAAGRAGRAERPGQVVIQTYQSDHYAIRTAAEQDYEAFYQEEIPFRRLMHYPPAGAMMEILVTSPSERTADAVIRQLAECIRRRQQGAPVQLIGPGTPAVGKIKDQFRRQLICKSADAGQLIRVREALEQVATPRDCYIQFDSCL